MRKIFLFMVCAIMVLSLVACGKETGDVGQVEKQGNQEQQVQQEKKVYGVGEYVKTENYEVAIAKVTKPTKWKFEPEEGKEYVAVEISIKNISDEDGSVGQSDFQYVGEDGKLTGRYPNTYSGFDVDPDTFGTEDLEIGQTFNGTIVYLMPKSMEEIELWFREGWTESPDAVFKFSK
ncbi:MAG: DUF4352 domain-containing protein [Parabacteroides sp.]|nr:DUF4352 domain-containing protein [Parabacteroides sp.]